MDREHGFDRFQLVDVLCAADDNSGGIFHLLIIYKRDRKNPVASIYGVGKYRAFPDIGRFVRTFVRGDRFGDSSIGIVVCLSLFQQFDKMKCALFTGEEELMKGSSNLDISFFKSIPQSLPFNWRG